MRCGIFIVGGRHTRTSCSNYSISSATVLTDVSVHPHCASTMQWLARDSRSVASDLCWHFACFKRVRVLYGFAAFRSASQYQDIAEICSSGRCRACLSMFDEEYVLVAIAAFVVVSNTRKRKRPEIF